jgi:succinate dehydrogenase / fumarate reductase membrane anchor subunit
MTIQDFRAGLAKAKGMGSAKSGMHHWLMQRITAVVVALCVIWIFSFAHSISGKSPADIVLTLQKPQHAIPLMILIISSFYHAALGMQVVIEDYVPNLCVRYGLIFGVKLFSYVTIVAALAAVVYLMVL